MKKNAPEIIQLRLDVETNINRKVRTPYDFEFLAGAIWERLHENISPTTLKRLWGYIDGADDPRWNTLSMLSRFLGFKDWEHYLSQLAMRDDIESETFRCKGVLADQLQTGDVVEVTRLPNRLCHFRYEGERRFTVTVAQNAKLHEGDTFSAAAFLIGQPMYLDNVKTVDSNASTTSYVAGKRNGILTARVL